MKLKDLTGQRFGRLRVLGRAGASRAKKTTWFCTCNCGRRLVVNGDNLISGNTSSCGCLKSELRRALNQARRAPPVNTLSRMHYFESLTVVQKRVAIENMARAGMSEHGIAAATQLSVEQVRRILECEGCEE